MDTEKENNEQMKVKVISILNQNNEIIGNIGIDLNNFEIIDNLEEGYTIQKNKIITNL